MMATDENRSISEGGFRSYGVFRGKFWLIYFEETWRDGAIVLTPVARGKVEVCSSIFFGIFETVGSRWSRDENFDIDFRGEGRILEEKFIWLFCFRPTPLPHFTTCFSLSLKKLIKSRKKGEGAKNSKFLWRLRIESRKGKNSWEKIILL